MKIVRSDFDKFKFIDISHMQNKEISRYFKCTLCLSVAIDPIKCNKCTTVLCRKCDDSRIKECPNKCSILPKSFVELTIIEKNI